MALRPGIISNNRLGIYAGDTDTPEQSIPATGIPGRDWEILDIGASVIGLMVGFLIFTKRRS